MRPRLERTRVRAVLGAVVLSALTFAVTSIAVASARRGTVEATKREVKRLDALRDPGPQLVMIYIGSAHCRWSRDPETARLVRQARDSLAKIAERKGVRFTTVGIAVDLLQREGIAHLASITDFDQVSSGDAWVNETAAAVIWSKYGAPASTPQLLVIGRDFAHEGGGASTLYRFDNERLLLRKDGLHAIRDWVTRDGAAVARLAAR